MRSKTLLGALLLVTLVLSACGPATTPSPTALPTTVVTEPPATESPVATEPAATDTQAAESPTAGVPVTGEATVMASDSTEYGPILVDGDGAALYVLAEDTQNGGTSACTGDCTQEWIPLQSQGAPVAGTGVDATLLSTITRDDGTLQVTYNGRPLYHFDEDMAAGDTNGQGVEDEFGHWSLVSATGEPVQ
jgi:predicted lipoprotein with Yx(FWY)xxD motif